MHSAATFQEQICTNPRDAKQAPSVTGQLYCDVPVHGYGNTMHACKHACSAALLEVLGMERTQLYTYILKPSSQWPYMRPHDLCVPSVSFASSRKRWAQGQGMCVVVTTTGGQNTWVARTLEVCAPLLSRKLLKPTEALSSSSRPPTVAARC